MFILVRTLTYAALFIGLVLIYLPARILSWAGIVRPESAVVFFLITHLFVVWFEEPTLRRMFGQEYEDYCRKIGRWWPGASNRA